MMLKDDLVQVCFVVKDVRTAGDVRLESRQDGGATRCTIVIWASDADTDLTVRIKQNGVDIFSEAITVPRGTWGGAVNTCTLTSPLSITKGDGFAIDCGQPSSWQFTARLEK